MTLMRTNYETYVWNYFKSRIGNEYGVAGLMGNLYAESGIIPNNLQNTYESSLGMSDSEYTYKVDTGTYTNFVHDEAGYGIAQWTYWSRKQALYDLYKSSGYNSISSIGLQCDYLWYELNMSYPGVLSVLQNASSIREASDSVLHDFESPADQSVSVENYRESLGVNYYEIFNGTYTEPVDPDIPGEEVVTKKKEKGFNWVLFNARRRMYGKR